MSDYLSCLQLVTSNGARCKPPSSGLITQERDGFLVRHSSDDCLKWRDCANNTGYESKWAILSAQGAKSRAYKSSR